MNNSSVIKVNPSIHSAEVCCLSLYHGSAIMVVNTLIALLGTFGNFLVCLAVLTKPRLRRCSNIPLLSLAIADLIITVICEPLVVAMVGKITFLHECAPSLELGYSLLANLCCSSSVMHLVAISMDRFLAVTFPLRHGRIMKNYGLKIMLATVWVVAFAFTIVRQLFPRKTYYLAAVMFAVGYFLMFVCYLLILLTLVRGRKRKGRLGAQSSIDVNLKVERRVALTLAIVIILFSVSWFPLVDVFFHYRKISGWKVWSSIHVN